MCVEFIYMWESARDIDFIFGVFNKLILYLIWNILYSIEVLIKYLSLDTATTECHL